MGGDIFRPQPSIVVLLRRAEDKGTTGVLLRRGEDKGRHAEKTAMRGHRQRLSDAALSWGTPGAPSRWETQEGASLSAFRESVALP